MATTSPPPISSPPPPDPSGGGPPPSDPVVPPPSESTAPPSFPPPPPQEPSSPPSVETPPPPPASSPPNSPATMPPPPSPSDPPPPAVPPPPPPSPSDPLPPAVPPPPGSSASSPPPRSSPSPPSLIPPPQNVTTPPRQPNPPENSPPPPPSIPPPENSPPPPTPLRSPPPPPISDPPENSPPPPSTVPPMREPPPPQNASPPDITSPPPPHEPSPATPSIPSPPPPSGNQTENDSTPNASASSISTGNGSVGAVGVIAIGIAAGILVLSLLGLVLWCLRKKRQKVSGLGGYVMPSSLDSSPRSESALMKVHSPVAPVGSGSGSNCLHSPADTNGLGNSRSLFTYEELATATNGFADANLLGEGGFGSVYKGNLSDGREVAVKELKIGSSQGEREFKAEVDIIRHIHHRHLVTLVGYCVSVSRRLLVYDYVPNDTLYNHLHGKNGPILDWARRFKIASGAARGLAYLHEDCHPRIIHRDIKSSNILLNENFEAQISDFGLAKLALDANTHVTTRVMGTFGYVAPEYASSGKLTEKSDVFSFGVVLLELITGRKPVDMSRPLGDESLVQWARPMLSRALDGEDFESLLDPRLRKNYVESEMFRMIEVAAACVRHSATRRPRMGQVVRAFDMVGSSDLTNGMRVGESEAFNSAQQSAEIKFFRRLAFGSQDYSTDFLVQGSSVA